MKKHAADAQHIQRTEMCNAISSRTAEDINKYNEEKLLKYPEDNKGITSTKIKQYLTRNSIIATLIHDLDSILKKGDGFFAKLCRFR